MVVLLALLGPIHGCGRPAADGPSIILITVDTLRADRVGLYAREHAPTPHMDRLGREGAVAALAVAPIPRTTQSVATIITGLHPFRHGADGLASVLPTDVTTIAERLRARGYRTAAFVSNVNLAPGRNFEQGFEVYRNPPSRWKGNSAAALSREAATWLARERPAGPLFLWVHYLDPHWPYEPAPQFLRLTDPDSADAGDDVAWRDIPKAQLLFAANRLLDGAAIRTLERRYSAEVAATDAAIGFLVDALAREHVLDDAILVLTSDHGEAMGGHGYWFGHGEMLYDDTLHVPLVFRAPGRIPAGTRLEGIVPLEDVVPTVLGLAGLAVDPAEFDGNDVSDLVARGGRQTAPADVVLHANDHQHLHAGNPRRALPGREGRWLAVRRGGWKLIRIPVAPGEFEEELYRFDEDPREADDVAKRHPDQVAHLSAALEEALGRFGMSPAQDAALPDETTRDALRSLGYLAD